jgi:hypothetical protein
MPITCINLLIGVQFNGYSSKEVYNNYIAHDNSARVDFENLPNRCNEYALGGFMKIERIHTRFQPLRYLTFLIEKKFPDNR